jgi:hypothetical protein
VRGQEAAAELTPASATVAMAPSRLEPHGGDARLSAEAPRPTCYIVVMPQPTKVLASRFRRALLYVVEALGEVSVTKLQKILYLTDLEHFNATGTTLTGARWVRYTHGPMAKALVPSTNEMDGHEITVSVEQAGPYEAKLYRPGPAPRFRPALSSEERLTLDAVIALTRSLSATEAIGLAYNTGPMRFLLRIEASTGSIMLDTEIPFEVDDVDLAAAASPRELPDPDRRAAFKRQELARTRDLRERGMAAASPD